MKLPISWLNDYIDLEGLSIEEIARRLTLAGLEVEEIKYVGLPIPDSNATGMHAGEGHAFKISGISWDRDKIVVAEIREVKPHPNADRLTLLDLFDGEKDQVVLTGAPNIFHLKGAGKLAKPLKVAYAKEGSTIYDGHADGFVLTTLKRAKIRGVESYSMTCSEKELGISDEHEGIIILDDEAPVGTSLVDYMGDAVLDIDISPNMARNACVIGVARELAAMTGRQLKKPTIEYKTEGESVEKLVSIEINAPQLNPRFVLGLIRDVEIKPSPYWVQRRLHLAGIRAISNVVDATNYAMLDQGEPLHAFDYDVLKKRAVDKNIKIITRTAHDGEKLTTLDDVERKLNSTNVLVCDEAGSLSMAGIMGGAESEVTDKTRNILLEGAAWNFINIRKTAKQHNLPSEASFRFSRGVHPSLAETGVRRGLQLMAGWSGGKIAPGLVDAYPLQPKDSVVDVTPQDVKRLLGITLTVEKISELLTHLEFKCERTNAGLRVTAPSHRLDIGEGVVGLADVLEEVARSYGYDNIPETRMADTLPPQAGNPVHEWEEHVRDILVRLGMQEIVSYRLTSPERESRVAQYDDYVVIANPTAPERRVMRRSLLASVLESVEKNSRAETISLFEIGPVFEPVKNDLPKELRRLVMVMTGLRRALSWDASDSPAMDFFDMKGHIEFFLNGLRYTDISYAPIDAVSYLHPGKAAQITINDKVMGVFGELHPLVKDKYGVEGASIMVGEFDLDMLRSISTSYEVKPVPEVPPVLEDIAVILDESIPASQVEVLIRQTGGKVLTNVRLFDVYRDEKIGIGKKSLAYSLTYQSDKTMTDAEAAAIRTKIVKRLEHEIGAKLRS